MRMFKSDIPGSNRTLFVKFRSHLADYYTPGQVFMELKGYSKVGVYAEGRFVMSKKDAIEHATKLLVELAPERLAKPARIPLLHLPVGTFLRKTAMASRLEPELVRVFSPVIYDVDRDIARGSDIPANERVRATDVKGNVINIFNSSEVTYWEPVEVEVTPPASATWTVVE